MLSGETAFMPHGEPEIFVLKGDLTVLEKPRDFDPFGQSRVAFPTFFVTL